MSASSAQFTFEFLDVDYELSVLDYFAVEKVLFLSGVNLTLVSDSQDIIASKDVVRQEGLLIINNPDSAGDPDRYFHGIICKFRYTGMNGRFHTYEAQLVPSLWLLSLKKNCRIFQDMKLQDIIGKIPYESGITSDLYEFRLRQTSFTSKFCSNGVYTSADWQFRRKP